MLPAVNAFREYMKCVRRIVSLALLSLRMLYSFFLSSYSSLPLKFALAIFPGTKGG